MQILYGTQATRNTCVEASSSSKGNSHQSEVCGEGADQQQGAPAPELRTCQTLKTVFVGQVQYCTADRRSGCLQYCSKARLSSGWVSVVTARVLDTALNTQLTGRCMVNSSPSSSNIGSWSNAKLVVGRLPNQECYKPSELQPPYGLHMLETTVTHYCVQPGQGLSEPCVWR